MSNKGGRIAPSRKQAVQTEIQTLADLLTHLKISKWDAVIVGDGSGAGWDTGAGWAAVLIDYYSNARKLFYGAMNIGTVTISELMPYLHAMSWYTASDGPGAHRRRELLALNKALQVHIVTDSQIIATAGNNPGSRRSHKELWCAFDEYRRRGFDLAFHYVPRSTVSLNVLVDVISRESRISLQGIEARALSTLGLPDSTTIYEFSV